MNAETICAAANLSGYPTIKYYAPFTLTREGDTGYNRASHVSCCTFLLVANSEVIKLILHSPHCHFFGPA